LSISTKGNALVHTHEYYHYGSICSIKDLKPEYFHSSAQKWIRNEAIQQSEHAKQPVVEIGMFFLLTPSRFIFFYSIFL
jgi:hypothetical protein